MNTRIKKNSRIAAITVLYYPAIDQLIKQFKLLSRQADTILFIDNTPAHICYDVEYKKLGAYYIRNNANFGVARAFNIGISWALDNAYSHVLLMDQDSSPAPDMVEKLLSLEIKLLQHGVNVGAIGPCIDKSSKYSLANLVQSCQDYSIVHRLISSGTLIRTSVLRNVGLMNEALFIDAVDDEWCFRAGSEGYVLICSYNAEMQHNLGNVKRILFGKITVNYHAPIRYYYMFRNYIYMLKQDFVPMAVKKQYVKSLFSELFKLFFVPSKVKCFKHMLRGLLAAVSFKS